jgi:hypothetical protein
MHPTDAPITTDPEPGITEAVKPPVATVERDGNGSWTIGFPPDTTNHERLELMHSLVGAVSRELVRQGGENCPDQVADRIGAWARDAALSVS